MMLSFIAIAVAQKSEILAAKNSYALFEFAMTTKTELSKKLETLNLAKASIDKATANEKTKSNAEAWTYKAIIYSAIAVNDTINVANANDAFTIAKEAATKARELDTEKKNTVNIENAEKNLSIVMQNKGVAAYNKKDYKEAFDAFKYIADITPTDSLFNMYTAISANNAKMPDEAIKYYNQTLATHTTNPSLYQELGRLYLAKSDTANALKTFEEARAKHPENVSLMFDELNIYLNKGQVGSQIAKIDAAIAKEPNNKTLYFVSGIANNANKNYAKAEAAYKKVLEMDPNYADAIFNLAVLYINKGNDFITEANKLPNLKSSDAKYNVLKSKFEAELAKALPLLEKSRELNPKDSNTLTALKEVYGKLNKMDKAAEVRKALSEL